MTEWKEAKVLPVMVKDQKGKLAMAYGAGSRQLHQGWKPRGDGNVVWTEAKAEVGFAIGLGFSLSSEPKWTGSREQNGGRDSGSGSGGTQEEEGKVGQGGKPIGWAPRLGIGSQKPDA
jgi:hypothetical protein